MNRDYNQVEVDIILDELLTIQVTRFNKTEIRYLETLSKMETISHDDRDHIVDTYNRVKDS